MIAGIDPETIIGDCLETAFDLKTYTKILTYVKEDTFHATDEFRKLYNGFYRVRQKSPDWYDLYYRLMEEQRSKQRNIKEVLMELRKVKASIEVSFASKLIATINPDMPIWDQYVLRNLGFEKEWNKYQNASYMDRIAKAGDLYAAIKGSYLDFQNSSKGRECILKFNETLPKYAQIITDTKKIDYILWSKR